MKLASAHALLSWCLVLSSMDVLRASPMAPIVRGKPATDGECTLQSARVFPGLHFLSPLQRNSHLPWLLRAEQRTQKHFWSSAEEASLAKL